MFLCNLDKKIFKAQNLKKNEGSKKVRKRRNQNNLKE